MNSREELKQYCLRALGHPVINIEVADEQIEDRINDAMQIFIERHFDGVNRKFHEITIDQDMYDSQTIFLPNEILSIIHIYKPKSGINGDLWMTDQWQEEAHAWRSVAGGGSLVNLEMTGQMLNAIDKYTTTLAEYTFNKSNNQLNLLGKYPPVGTKIMLETYTAINTVDTGNIDPYNDAFVKKYSTALIKKQWGQNLSKFEGSNTLPGGLAVSGADILSDAKEDIEKLLEELDLRYTAPLNFFIG
jgi:hypothetical protein